jgi:hypothetical protein
LREKLYKLYKTKTGGSLSTEDCQTINIELADITVEKIPMDQRENVSDYLLNALNYETVEPQLSSKLEVLLHGLQKSA